MKYFSKLFCLLLVGVFVASAAGKRIVLIAGKPSHRPGDHEFRAGCILLNKWLNKVPGIKSEMHALGWPKSDAVFKGADAIFIFADGGGRHPAIQQKRAQLLGGLVKKGVGIGCAHYGVEVPAGDTGKTMQNWIGGYYEHKFSVNPMWSPNYQKFPKHPVANGVKPFKVLDEWYFNMRFRTDGVGKITPILSAKPGKEVRNGPYVFPKGPYKHIIEGVGRAETMMWAYDRPDGGRGFGFTGGHKHVNWGNENFRKVVLNGLLWIAKAEVPKNGVQASVTEEELKKNWDR
jgi:type 1 glutamine amidotransferase